MQLRVLQVSQVAVNAISLNSVPVSQRDRNITTLMRYAMELKLHEFQTVEGAVSFVRDPDVMDTLALTTYDTMPKGDYIFFPFQSCDTPCRP